MVPDAWLRKLGLLLIALTHVLGGLAGIVLIPSGLRLWLISYPHSMDGMLLGGVEAGFGGMILVALVFYIGALQRHARLQHRLDEMGVQLEEIRRELARSREDSPRTTSEAE